MPLTGQPRTEKETIMMPEGKHSSLRTDSATGSLDARHATFPTTDETERTSPVVSPLPVPKISDQEGTGSIYGVSESEVDRRRKSRKTLAVAGIAIAIVALVGVAAFAMTRKPAEEPAPVAKLNTTAVYKSDFTNTVSATGTVQALSSKNVAPEVSGTIESIKVSEGQTVQAGDVLFTLKNDDLDTAVDQAQNQLDMAQNTLDAAQAQADTATNSYNTAADAYNKAIAAGKTASFDKATLENAVNQANTALTNAGIALDNAQKTYDTAVATAKKRTVTAPQSGTVTALGAATGTYVMAGSSLASSAAATSSDAATTGTAAAGQTPLAQVSDVSQMVAVVQLSESDFEKVAEDQYAKVTFPALASLSVETSVGHISSDATPVDDVRQLDLRREPPHHQPRRARLKLG
jgi:HlyD family secretion protein